MLCLMVVQTFKTVNTEKKKKFIIKVLNFSVQSVRFQLYRTQNQFAIPITLLYPISL